ncbi:MAG: alpha/beta fold hydrolase [Chloroflexota bacterium]
MTGLTHRVKFPKNAENQEKHPTLVLIHGRHGNEDVPWIFARGIPENWPIVSPRAIEFDPETDEHETGYSWMLMRETGWPEFSEFDGATQALSDFILALPDVYQADPENIMLLGFSQGAATALCTAVAHPNICRGIASLVGFVPELDSELQSDQPLANLPVFMAIGERDDRVGLNIAKQSRDTLINAGADLTWDIYKTGHKLNSQGMRDLAAWLGRMIK